MHGYAAENTACKILLKIRNDKQQVVTDQLAIHETTTHIYKFKLSYFYINVIPDIQERKSMYPTWHKWLKLDSLHMT